MKRATLWTIGAGVVGVALMLALRAQEQPGGKAEPVKETAAPADKIAFTFSDDQKMQEFAQLWQQRQGIVTRTAVLQAYWGEEQARLAELNQQLLSQFNLDVNKNYTLDAERKVLVEREGPPPQPTQLGEPQAAAPAPPTSP